jgi:hypothetical protein
LKDATFVSPLENSYFDNYDFDNHVKQYYDDRFFYYFGSEHHHQVDIFLARNEATYNDRRSMFNIKTHDIFYTVDKFNNKMRETQEDELLLLRFFLDPNVISYNEESLSLTEALSRLGGFYGILTLIGRFIASYFSNKLMVYSLLKQLYQIDVFKEK